MFKVEYEEMNRINHSISLIIPALNEEPVIKQTVLIYHQDLKRLFQKHELIIVDDGSTDQTPAILKRLQKKIPQLKILTHKKNEGVGKAILDGFKEARSEWVMHNSADQPFNLNDLKKHQHLFDTTDVIVVVRKDRSANSFFRKITSGTSFLLVRLFFGVPIGDFHFIQVYKRSILKNIRIISGDTFAPAELLITLYKKGYRISQFTSHFHRRTKGSSKYNNPKRYLRYLRDLFNFWWRLKATH